MPRPMRSGKWRPGRYAGIYRTLNRHCTTSSPWMSTMRSRVCCKRATHRRSGRFTRSRRNVRAFSPCVVISIGSFPLSSIKYILPLVRSAFHISLRFDGYATYCPSLAASSSRRALLMGGINTWSPSKGWTWNRWRQNPAKISCTILLPGSPTQEAVQVMENGIVQFRLFPCYVLIRKGGV